MAATTCFLAELPVVAIRCEIRGAPFSVRFSLGDFVAVSCSSDLGSVSEGKYLRNRINYGQVTR